MKKLPAVLAALFLLPLSVASPSKATGTASAQTERQCFSQTGECIEGDFRTYWEQNGGIPVFGYPVTPARPEIDPATSATASSCTRKTSHPIACCWGGSASRDFGREVATL
jgi:hypothetical protein